VIAGFAKTGLAGRDGGGLNLDKEDAEGNAGLDPECPTVAKVEKLMLLELLLACLDDRLGCGAF
jgi:hypothetical protein